MLYKRLDVWKLSRILTIQIYKVMADCKDFGFRDQITRSALSVPSNIAEGCERVSIKERYRFMDIAKGSLGEFHTQAEIGIEIQLIDAHIGRLWLTESLILSRMIGALMAKLRQ